MAHFTIEKRIKADGTPRYRCTVLIKEKGKILYRESKTFSKQQFAKTWGTTQVSKLEQFGIPKNNDLSKLTLGDLLIKYQADPNLGEKAGRTKKNVIRLLIDSDIANVKLSDLKTHDLVEHCRLRAASGTGPATISHDISYLGSALESAKSAFNIDIDNTVIKEARPILKQMKLIGKSNKRSRRPVNNEIEQLIEALTIRQEQHSAHIPYVDILNFSILSCMRIGEICSLLWDDIDYNQKAILVRDRKDPRKKIGNHMLVPMLGKAWDILISQPKNGPKIFPYNSKSVSAGYQRVRDKLEIKDLRYHDLRREGASRLLEQGFAIEEVAQVTGHKNLQTLWNIYISLFPRSLHEKFNKLNNEK